MLYSNDVCGVVKDQCFTLPIDPSFSLDLQAISDAILSNLHAELPPKNDLGSTRFVLGRDALTPMTSPVL